MWRKISNRPLDEGLLRLLSFALKIMLKYDCICQTWISGKRCNRTWLIRKLQNNLNLWLFDSAFGINQSLHKKLVFLKRKFLRKQDCTAVCLISKICKERCKARSTRQPGWNKNTSQLLGINEATAARWLFKIPDNVSRCTDKPSSITYALYLVIVRTSIHLTNIVKLPLHTILEMSKKMVLRNLRSQTEFLSSATDQKPSAHFSKYHEKNATIAIFAFCHDRWKNAVTSWTCVDVTSLYRQRTNRLEVAWAWMSLQMWTEIYQRTYDQRLFENCLVTTHAFIV